MVHEVAEQCMSLQNIYVAEGVCSEWRMYSDARYKKIQEHMVVHTVKSGGGTTGDYKNVQWSLNT